MYGRPPSQAPRSGSQRSNPAPSSPDPQRSGSNVSRWLNQPGSGVPTSVQSPQSFEPPPTTVRTSGGNLYFAQGVNADPRTTNTPGSWEFGSLRLPASDFSEADLPASVPLGTYMTRTPTTRTTHGAKGRLLPIGTPFWKDPTNGVVFPCDKRPGLVWQQLPEFTVEPYCRAPFPGEEKEEIPTGTKWAPCIRLTSGQPRERATASSSA